MSEDSKYPLQTDVATRELHRLNEVDEEIRALRASLSEYGMTKLSTATDISDANAYAMSAIEKNPNIPNTIGASLSTISNQITNINNIISSRICTTLPICGTQDATNPTVVKYKPKHEGIFSLSSSQYGGWSSLTSLYFVWYSPIYQGSTFVHAFREIKDNVDVTVNCTDGIVIKSYCLANFWFYVRLVS